MGWITFAHFHSIALSALLLVLFFFFPPRSHHLSPRLLLHSFPFPAASFLLFKSGRRIADDKDTQERRRKAHKEKKARQTQKKKSAYEETL